MLLTCLNLFGFTYSYRALTLTLYQSLRLSLYLLTYHLLLQPRRAGKACYSPFNEVQAINPTTCYTLPLLTNAFTQP